MLTETKNMVFIIVYEQTCRGFVEYESIVAFSVSLTVHEMGMRDIDIGYVCTI